MNHITSYEIAIAQERDFRGISDVWERSVRATHHFLPEEYLQEIKALLPSILPSVPVYKILSGRHEIAGFLGVAGEKIEMLFIDPDYRGRGMGYALTEYAVRKLGAKYVDVNEQNQQAVDFYRRAGFMITGRDELDGMGRSFPLLLLERSISNE